MDSDQRKYLHIAGIIVNNFSNFFFAQAFDFLESKNINTDFLRPLINETIYKLKGNKPENLQTGPAKRGSMDIVDEHLFLLENNPQIKELYSYLSKSIFEYYNNKNE